MAETKQEVELFGTISKGMALSASEKVIAKRAYDAGYSAALEKAALVADRFKFNPAIAAEIRALKGEMKTGEK